MSRIPTPVAIQASQYQKSVKASINFQPKDSLASVAGSQAGTMPHKASRQPAQTLNSPRNVAVLHTNELPDGRSRLQDSTECVNSTSSVAGPHMGKTRLKPRRLPIYVGRPGENELPVRASSVGASGILSADLLRQGSEVDADLTASNTGSKPNRIPTCPKISGQYASVRPTSSRRQLGLPATDLPPPASERAAGSPALVKRSIPRRIPVDSQPGLTSSIKYVPLKDITRPTSITKPTPTTKPPPQKPSLGITGSKFHEDLNGDVPGYGQDANIMHSLDTLQDFVRFYPKKAASSQALLPSPDRFTQPRTRAQYEAAVKRAALKKVSYKTLTRADTSYLLPGSGSFGQAAEEVMHVRRGCEAPPAGRFAQPRTRAQYEDAVSKAARKKASYKTLTRADGGYVLPRVGSLRQGVEEVVHA